MTIDTKAKKPRVFDVELTGNEEDIAEVVHRCNLHDELVATLDSCERILRGMSGLVDTMGFPDDAEVMISRAKIAHTLLAKAQESQP